MAYVFRRYILLLTFLPCLCVADAQRPVTVDFSVQRKDAQTVVLLAKVKVQKGVQLFTTDKKTGKEFVSSLLLDSTIAKYSRPVREEGILLHHYDSAVSGDLHYFQDSVTLQQLISLPDTSSIGMIKGTYSWLAKDDEGFPSGDTAFSVIIEKGGNGAVSKGLTVAGAQDVPDSAWHIFAICFLAGLVMVFTPCVFPLIPVTVSFFLKKSRNRADGIRNAVWYSVSIILIYTVPTFIITLLFGETAMYRIATSVAANILFFVVFVLFAVSFFGAFELTLPHKWANKADEKANKGGILGIFFMALTLVIVSFSCTGPIVGTLLAQVSGTNAIMAPVMGMLGLSAGLAIPFSLFAFFPTMLQALPKSGGWLNSVQGRFRICGTGAGPEIFVQRGPYLWLASARPGDISDDMDCAERNDRILSVGENKVFPRQRSPICVHSTYIFRHNGILFRCVFVPRPMGCTVGINEWPAATGQYPGL